MHGSVLATYLPPEESSGHHEIRTRPFFEEHFMVRDGPPGQFGYLCSFSDRRKGLADKSDDNLVEPVDVPLTIRCHALG